jgi:hypothetical protein
MNPDEYMQALRDQLKPFSRQEQEELLEEIGSHFESGEEDAHLGKDLEQRNQKMLAEMGSPEQMGSGFKKVHHPDGWIDYLLVIGPLLLEMFVIYYFHIDAPTRSLAFRISFGLVCLILVVLGLRRRSNLFVLTWIGIFTSWIISILISIGTILVPEINLDPADLRYTMVFRSPESLQVSWFKGLQFGEGIFWLTMFAGAIYLLGWIIWQNRSDRLIVSYAILEFAGLVCSYIVPLFMHQTGWDQQIEGFKFQSLQTMMVWMDTPILFNILSFVMWGILFIAYKRPIRWAALAGLALCSGLENGVYMYRPSVYVLPEYFQLILLPLAIILLGWWVERSKKQRFMVTA